MQIPPKKYGRRNNSNSSILEDKKHVYSNTFSITIRTGNGLILGEKTVTNIEQYFEDHFDEYILSVEKKGMQSHFQGGCFMATPKRQDHIYRDLKKLTLELYEAQSDEIPSTKQLTAVGKHALEVKPHDGFKKLITYCSKEGYFAVHKYKLNEPHRDYLYSRITCEDHNNPLSIYHEDSVTLENPWYSCPKCPILPFYFLKNVRIN